MARIVEAVATARPAAIAIDVLFAEPDDRSPAALARRLGSVTGRAEISTLGESLPDGDKRLARAVGSVPTALGFVLDPDRNGILPGAAITTAGRSRSTICGRPQARSGRRCRSGPRPAGSAHSRYLVAPMARSVRFQSSLPPVAS